MAEVVERNVKAEPCSNCSATDKFTKFEKNGSTWLTCSRKIGDAYCNGRPSTDASPATGKDASSAGGGQPVQQAPVPSTSRTEAVSNVFGQLADQYEKLSDTTAVISTLYREAREAMK